MWVSHRGQLVPFSIAAAQSISTLTPRYALPPARSGLDTGPRLVSGLPRLQPCQISALKISDDFAGDSAVNVQFLAHGLPLSRFWVLAADEPLPLGESGVASGIGMLKLPWQLFWGAPALAGGAKTSRAAPLQRARAEPLEKARVCGHMMLGRVCGHKRRVSDDKYPRRPSCHSGIVHSLFMSGGFVGASSAPFDHPGRLHVAVRLGLLDVRITARDRALRIMRFLHST